MNYLAGLNLTKSGYNVKVSPPFEGPPLDTPQSGRWASMELIHPQLRRNVFKNIEAWRVAMTF